MNSMAQTSSIGIAKASVEEDSSIETIIYHNEDQDSKITAGPNPPQNKKISPKRQRVRKETSMRMDEESMVSS